MKKFSTFITEAVKSSAAEQAKKLGLTHAGYGRWMDKQGNVTHFSKQGKLLPVATDQSLPRTRSKEVSLDGELGHRRIARTGGATFA